MNDVTLTLGWWLECVGSEFILGSHRVQRLDCSTTRFSHVRTIFMIFSWIIQSLIVTSSQSCLTNNLKPNDIWFTVTFVKQKSSKSSHFREVEPLEFCISRKYMLWSKNTYTYLILLLDTNNTGIILQTLISIIPVMCVYGDYVVNVALSLSSLLCVFF